jgi:hypothetical protein
MRQAVYALQQNLDNPPNCTHPYNSQLEIERGMIAGAELYQNKYPLRENKGDDDFGIA